MAERCTISVEAKSFSELFSIQEALGNLGFTPTVCVTPPAEAATTTCTNTCSEHKEQPVPAKKPTASRRKKPRRTRSKKTRKNQRAPYTMNENISLEKNLYKAEVLMRPYVSANEIAEMIGQPTWKSKVLDAALSLDLEYLLNKDSVTQFSESMRAGLSVMEYPRIQPRRFFSVRDIPKIAEALGVENDYLQVYRVLNGVLTGEYGSDIQEASVKKWRNAYEAYKENWLHSNTADVTNFLKNWAIHKEALKNMKLRETKQAISDATPKETPTPSATPAHGRFTLQG